LLQDSLERGLVEIAERDVVAVQERQPEVVVLDVQALAHAARELVDEAEDALVRAGGDVAGARRLELDAELDPGAAPEPQRVTDAIALDAQRQPVLATVELEIDGVTQRPAVDRQDAIAGDQPRRRGRGARPHRRHHDALSGRARFHPARGPPRRGWR
jgi:hypothetical protein